MTRKKLPPKSEALISLQKAFPRQPVNLTEEQRVAAKARYLDAMGRINNNTASCEAAGISMASKNAWIREGFITQEELEYAYLRYQDMIRGEIAKRVFVGDEQPLVYNGRIVLDDEGRPQTVRKRDNRMLAELARRHLPEWQQPERVEIMQHTIVDGIPEQYRLVLDARQFLPEEWETIKGIAEAMELRSGKLVEGTVS